VTTDRLEVQGISAGYGDLQALWNISLSVEPGRATVLLGPNGAGKTTTLSAIMGVIPLWQGSIIWRGQNIDHVPAHRRVHLGLSLVQENKQVFKKRTVEENLMLAGYTTVKGRRELRKRMDEQYDRFPILKTRAKLAASTLSGGEQQMLAIAQALIPKPSILILDEPTAGLAPVILKSLFEAISRLKDEGHGILLVEQVVHQALKLADEVSVLNVGRIAHHAQAKDMTDSKVIEEVYFGARPHVASNTEQPPADS
jgi:branched-chain amino acid transport system ATP-binding protein